jgi:N6-L-threonylcarbamoyladenine synthase
MPHSKVDGAPLDLSFSGLKTAALNLIHNAQQKGEELDLPSFAASFGKAISDTLVPRTMLAAQELGYGKVAVAGGVAANSRIRADLTAACQRSGYQLFMPDLKLCGDNGAMIGCQGYYEYLAGTRGDWSLNGYATMDIGNPK